MATQSLPVSASHVREQSQERATARTPSLRAVIAVFVALLILVSWLRLILALEIALTGRQIQMRTQELEAIERGNDLIRIDIARAESPTGLAELAYELGFRPRKPVYIPLASPLAGSSGDEAAGRTGPGTRSSSEETLNEDEQSLLDLATEELGPLLEAEAAP